MVREPGIAAMTVARHSLPGINILGWPDDRLDEMLADPDVLAVAESALVASLDDNGAWTVSRLFAACQRKHRRIEAARLLFDLAYRRMQVTQRVAGGTA